MMRKTGKHGRAIRRTPLRRRGFSFAEMMVAVAILALLTAVTGMVLLNLVKRARTQQTRVIMDDVLSALIAYRDEKGQWPRDANADCRAQAGYVAAGFDNGRVFKKSLIGKPLQGTSGNTWFDPATNKWVDDNVTDVDMVWDSSLPPAEQVGIFGELAEHLLVMMKVSASRAVLAKLEEAGSLGRREATDVLVRQGCIVSGEKYSVFFVADGWGTEMLYRRFESENDGMPQLLSAGPDKAFGTDDDIRSTDRR